jgi:hypothetical protein
MKITQMLSPIIFLAVTFFAGPVYAYESAKVDELCKKPQFKDFNLPIYKEPEKTEIPPESTLVVLVSPWANLETLKLTVKDQNLEYTAESNSSFHRIKAKLPASFNGKFVRINISAKSIGGCSDKNGWLLKVKG